MTMMRSAARTVARRWAMTIVVRPSISRSSEPWTSRSLSASSARGRLVEQQQGRIAEQGAGDGDALALAAGEPGAAFAEIGVEPLGQLRAGTRPHWRLGRAPELGVARLPAAVAQIVARRGGEDDRLLRHHRDPRADVGRVGLAQVDAVEPDAARLGIVEALGELEEGRLAGARGPDQGQRLARPDREAEIVQRADVRPGRVAEGDGVERERAARRLGQRRPGWRGRGSAAPAASSSAIRPVAPAPRSSSP